MFPCGYLIWFFRLSGACGSLSRWSRGRHSGFKYSMSGECPPTSIQINTLAVEPLTAGAHRIQCTGRAVLQKLHTLLRGAAVIFRNKLGLPAFWNLTCFVEVSWPHTPLPPFLPPLYLHCICAQMSTHVSRLRQTKRSRVWLQVSETSAQIHREIGECILLPSQLPGLVWLLLLGFFRATFAQRKAEIWGAQVGALSKVPTDPSAQRRRTHLLTVWTQLDQNPTGRLTPPWTRYPAAFDWERWVFMHSSLGRRGGGHGRGWGASHFPSTLSGAAGLERPPGRTVASPARRPAWPENRASHLPGLPNIPEKYTCSLWHVACNFTPAVLSPRR